MMKIKYISSENSGFRLVVWTIFAIVFSLGMPLSPITLQCPTVDSAIFMICAQWMQDGLVMYKDMFDHKGPLIYLFDMAGLKMGVTGVWLLCAFFSILTTYVVFHICRIYSNAKHSFVASLCFLLMVVITGGDNTVELVAMPFVALAMLVLMRPLHEKREVPLLSVFCATICLSATFLLKPNLGAAIAFLALVIFMDLFRNFTVRRLCGYLLAFVGGVVIVFLPFFLWLNNLGAWDDYISVFWKFNMEYSSNLSLASKFVTFFQLFVLYIPCLVSWGFVILCTIREWKTEKRIEILWLLAMLMFVGYVTSGVSGFRFGHYLLPVFIVFAIFIAKAFESAPVMLKTVMCGVVALWLCYFGYKDYKTFQNSNSSKLLENIEIAEYVKANTSATDRICLYGVDASVYLLSERKSVTRYIYQNPIFGIRPSMYDEFVRDINSKHPVLLLVGDKEDLPQSVLKKYSPKKQMKNGVMVYAYKG